MFIDALVKRVPSPDHRAAGGGIGTGVAGGVGVGVGDGAATVVGGVGDTGVAALPPQARVAHNRTIEAKAGGAQCFTCPLSEKTWPGRVQF
jgi:hypothetical protein